MNETSQDFSELTRSKDFNELLQIGHITQKFEWSGHKFEIKTLTIEEELVVGQLVKEYKDSIAEEKAVAVALAAASLVSINDKPFMPSYEKTAFISIRERFNYIKDNWHWIVVENLNTEYIQLLARLYQNLEDTENLSKTDRMNLSFSSDPMIERES